MGDSKSQKQPAISLLVHAPMGQGSNGHPGCERSSTLVSSGWPKGLCSSGGMVGTLLKNWSMAKTYVTG